MILAFAGLLIGGYLVGSIPFGVLVGRGLFGVDPRSVGSGNIGAANALRALGKTGAVLVLAGDILKGVIPTFAALHYYSGLPWLAVAVGLATVAGHTWSLFLGFGGGKGVATGLGVLVVLSWQAALVFAAVWAATVALSRYASLGSILANAAAPIALLLFAKPRAYVIYACLAFALVVWRHERNIKRLIAGTELRIGSPKES